MCCQLLCSRLARKRREEEAAKQEARRCGEGSRRIQVVEVDDSDSSEEEADDGRQQGSVGQIPTTPAEDGDDGALFNDLEDGQLMEDDATACAAPPASSITGG